MKASAWLAQHSGRFSSPSMCSRIITVLGQQFGAEYTLDELRAAVANSWVQGDRVIGALGGIRRLGVQMFDELARALT